MVDKKQSAQSLSIAPTAFAHGTGLIDDVDCLIESARWVIWDYQGKSAQVTAACVNYLVDVEGEMQENPAYYSIGKEGSASFIPSKDGKTLMKIGQREALSDGCNFFQFISSVVNAGYDEAQIEGTDISFMDNWFVHVKREAQPERQGLKKEEGARDKTVLCISKIISQDGKPGKGSKAAAGKAASAGGNTKAAGGKANGAAAVVDDDLETAAVDAILQALGENDGTLVKAKLSQALFQQLKGNPLQTKVVKLAFDDGFLGAEGRPWTLNGAEVSMG